VHGHDVKGHPLHGDPEAKLLELTCKDSRLGKPRDGFREIAVGGRLIATEETRHRGHNPPQIEAVRREQRAGGWRELEDHQPSPGSQDPPHLAQRRVSIDQVAEPEADGDGVDTGVGLREPADVPLSELHFGLELARQLQHPGREIDPDDTPPGAHQRHQLVGQLAGAGAEIERGLAGLQPSQPSGAPPPGGVARQAEHPVSDVVAGRHLVEHRPDPVGPRFLPHDHDYADHVAELARRVGLGLAARGSVTDTAEWARRAEDLGLESIWIHDSYFERDPITYLTAIGMQTRRIGLGAGALNPYTRHSVVVAMTMSALDDLAPRRVTLALGSGLPLRLSQMAIPYDDTVARVSESIDQIRRLWSGQPLKLNEKVPPLQPMFQPPHRIPIYIAAYRTPFLDLCGEKADGYLARPAESLPAFQKMRARVLESSSAHGRSAGDIDFRGYLLCLFDSSRQEALNRAKREPFVIYMMSVLSDISMKRAGFDPDLRTQIATAWRAEDYHRAGELIPDNLLDAFILCGTVDEVAARAADYHDAGMDVPLLQPILQQEAQINAVFDAAVAYATRAKAPSLPSPAGGGGVGVPASVGGDRTPVAAGAGRVGPGLARRLAGAWEVMRPFSFTASLLPIAVGGAIALSQGRMHWTLFVAALLGGLGLHIGTNVVNEIYDVRHGIDAITSPRMSMAILKGRITERDAFIVAWSGFLLAALMGTFLLVQRGWPIVLLGLIGFVGGYFYTAPPFQYKYRALGLPLVFVLMGPLMVIGSYYAVTGTFDVNLLVVSVPVGLLVTAILHGNEWRDVAEDTRHGFTTFSAQVGRDAAHWVYVMLILGAYVAVGLAVMVGALPKLALLTLLSLPLTAWILRDAERGAEGHLRAIAMIDLMTARLHGAFGVLLLVGLVAGSAVR
jgi:1,4-dihydroxy-2-naphthoate polyprenyltransferase